MKRVAVSRLFPIAAFLLPALSLIGLNGQTRYPDVGGDQIRTETYLIPAPTSGPMSPAWSPDGEWIAFSMWGSIWRVPADGGVAEQLTVGPGYDFEPAYSPDGSRIAFVRDRDRQVDIWELGIGERQVTNDEAVDLQPSYSPDGEILFYSSRDGNFDIWTDTGAQLTRDRARDMQPSHAPVEPLFAFVSGRGAAVGTGGIWVQDRQTGNATEIYFEETVYRTRPAFSPDGQEILFSSRGDLWRVPAEGGIPVRVTFDEPAEEIEARWSPDGAEIVYVSDARQLRRVPREGGFGRAIPIESYRFRRATGRLEVELDGAARVSIVASDGRAYTPEGEFHHVSNSTATHYFHASGGFTIELPRGVARLRVSRGFAYRPEEVEVDVPGRVSVTLERAFDLPGWYSGDTHVHDRHSGIYPIGPDDMAMAAAAEDLNVVNMLIHVDGTRMQGDVSHFSGEDHPASSPGRILHYSQEYRSTLGHIALLGAVELVFPFFSGVAGTALALPEPPLFEVARAARERGATVGVPHPYYPGLAAGSVEGVRSGRGATEIPVDVALGLMDYFDINCIWADELTSAGIYYRLLNAGFRLPVAGGTDSFSDAPRDPPLGAARTYVRLDGPLTLTGWLAGLRAGRSFATNGPLLSLEVAGRGIGEVIELPAEGSVRVGARVMSVVDLDALEVVVNGEVVRRSEGEPLEFELDLDGPAWIAARALGGPHPLVGDEYAFAHTSPVYVEVGGRGVRMEAESEFLARYIEELGAWVESLPWGASDALSRYRAAYSEAIETLRAPRN